MSSAGLTPQQRNAVQCRGVSVVLSSGAGCGKTHVLTERYLSHLREDGAEVGQLVAITFTDRAARQMRDRIRKVVLQKVRGNEAGAEWTRHLRNLETAQISTIHAFCGNLLRQYAVEAGLDPHFDVLEDVLAVNFEGEALTECLQALLTAQTETGADLRELALLYGWRPTVEAIQSLLHQYDETPWQAWLNQDAAEIARRWQTVDRQRVLTAYVDHLLTASPKIAHCLALLRRTECVGPQTKANVDLLLAETPRLATAENLAAKIEELAEAAKVVPREKAKAWKCDEDYQAVKSAFEAFRDDLRDRLAPFADTGAEVPTAAEVGQRFLRVANAAALTYRQRKRRAGVVDFQDLLVLARDLLRDHAEVREQLQRRHRFLLIDELQDTDPVQMELVHHLCGGGLQHGKLFAVGDHKQSIYRFRGAEVELFLDLRRQVAREGRLDLSVNFRSQPAILDFTNALLGHRLQDYHPLEAHHQQLNEQPCVEFLWTRREDKENVAEARSHEADTIARRIVALVAGAEKVVRDTPAGPLRPARYGDIVLLFRAMSNVHLYEAALRRHGVDYYLVGGRAFFAQQEIYDLLNLLRALENPQDGVSLAGTLRSPFCCLSDEALLLLDTHAEGLWAGLHDPATLKRLPREQLPDVERAQRFLDRWRGFKDRLPIARLLGEVFADSGYDAATQFEFLGDRKLANLWKLTDLARTFDRSGLFGLAEFIQRLGDLVRNQPGEEQAATQPENADVVRLMTIHQAKGLEFPVVFVPDLAATGSGARYPVAVWDARLGCVVRPPADEDPPPFSAFAERLWKANEAMADWHEDLRTLYVACTRAEDYLVLSAALTEPYRPAGTWMLTLAERFNLQTGACLDTAISATRQPRVRVQEPANIPSFGTSRSQPVAPLALPTGADVGRAIAPIRLRLEERTILPLTTVEARLREECRPDTDDDLSTFVTQFDAEDGSDRSTWLSRRDRLDLWPPADRRLLDVLDRWDFRDAEGWKPLVRAGAPEAEAAVARFARSELFRRLADALESRRNLEFILAWPDGDTAHLPALSGLIDCLWQDGGGEWHLLAFDTTDGADRAPERWRRREAGLVVQAAAVEQQQGVAPASITLYSFATGRATSRSGKQLRVRQVLDDVRATLRNLCGNCVLG